MVSSTRGSSLLGVNVGSKQTGFLPILDLDLQYVITKVKFVILSEAKDLSALGVGRRKILRFAKKDAMRRGLSAAC